jgi:hypothetical protein
VQLRWVRRRLDAARHGACKGAASRRDLAGQDAREQAAVAAAMQAVAASKGLAHNRAAGGFVMYVLLFGMGGAVRVQSRDAGKVGCGAVRRPL